MNNAKITKGPLVKATASIVYKKVVGKITNVPPTFLVALQTTTMPEYSYDVENYYPSKSPALENSIATLSNNDVVVSEDNPLTEMELNDARKERSDIFELYKKEMSEKIKAGIYDFVFEHEGVYMNFTGYLTLIEEVAVPENKSPKVSIDYTYNSEVFSSGSGVYAVAEKVVKYQPGYSRINDENGNFLSSPMIDALESEFNHIPLGAFDPSITSDQLSLAQEKFDILHDKFITESKEAIKKGIYEYVVYSDPDDLFNLSIVMTESK